jgi:hypothetical protein
VLQLRPDDSVVDLTRVVPPEDSLGAGWNGFGVWSLKDLNGDGLWEWQVLDARWEFRFNLDHASSPAARRIYAWDGQVYRNASAQFSEYYRHWLEAVTADMRAVAEGDEVVGYYHLSGLISLLLNYENAGRGQEGWVIFKQYTDSALYASRQLEDDSLIYSLLEARGLFQTWYEPDSTPAAPADVTISTQPPSRDEGGRLHVLGEVTNHSTGPLVIGLVAGLYAADGSLVDVDSGRLVLNPGESKPYDLAHFTKAFSFALAQKAACSRLPRPHNSRNKTTADTNRNRMAASSVRTT